jgi:hypothetical protein
MAFLGGPVGEVLDEFLDPGATPAHARVEQMLESLERMRRAWKLEAHQIVLRGDAQYGTPAIIAKVEAYGFGYLFKGINTKRAAKLGSDLDETAWHEVSPRAEGEPRWAADLGERVFTSRAEGHRPKLEASVPGPRRPGPTTRARRAHEPKATRTCYAMLMTKLSAEQMPVAMALDSYDDRATIERYFRDEHCALGARSVRTHKAAGAAVFQWMVAMTNNLLRWMRGQYFAKTPLEHYGLERLVRRAFQIPARLIREAGRLRVILPERHLLVATLVNALSPPAATAPASDAAPPGACP